MVERSTENTSVTFNEPRSPVKQKREKPGPLERLIMRISFVKDRREANFVLLLIAVAIGSAAFYIFYLFS